MKSQKRTGKVRLSWFNIPVTYAAQKGQSSTKITEITYSLPGKTREDHLKSLESAEKVGHFASKYHAKQMVAPPQKKKKKKHSYPPHH